MFRVYIDLKKTMKVKQQTSTRMVLAGIPGGRLGIIALSLVGVLLTVGVVFFAVVTYKENKGVVWIHLPLLAGLFIAQTLLWTGVITLAVGRMTLILDTAAGTGEYRVRSPIVDAGRPCDFKLENVHGVTIETVEESRPRRAGHVSSATVHRARLRLSKPRRAITLDETENNRIDRVEAVAKRVASFLGTGFQRIDDR